MRVGALLPGVARQLPATRRCWGLPAVRTSPAPHPLLQPFLRTHKSLNRPHCTLNLTSSTIQRITDTEIFNSFFRFREPWKLIRSGKLPKETKRAQMLTLLEDTRLCRPRSSSVGSSRKNQDGTPRSLTRELFVSAQCTPLAWPDGHRLTAEHVAQRGGHWGMGPPVDGVHRRYNRRYNRCAG